MGYYTKYNLKSNHINHGDVIEKLRGEYRESAFSLNGNGDTQEGAKWYEHENHLKNFSLFYKDTLFILEGEGEEQGDIWRKYFKNGKMQECKAIISYEEFDERKLKV